MSRVRMVLTVCVLLGCTAVSSAQYEPAGCLSEAEEELIQLVNDYRQANALPAVPVSTTLTAVGQWHVEDSRYATEVSDDYGSNGSCNLHTWYGIPAAPFTTCCYTSDHAQAACMWSKPDEVSGGSYSATGFELAAAGYSDVAAALAGWKNSPGHNDVILNLNTWSSYIWNAMGVGADETGKWYFLWFSTDVDPQGAPGNCTTPVLPASWAAVKARF